MDTPRRPSTAPSRSEPAQPFSTASATPSVRHSSGSAARSRRSSLTTVPTRIVSSRPSLPTPIEAEVMPPVAWGWGPAPHLTPASRSHKRRPHSASGLFAFSRKTANTDLTPVPETPGRSRRGVRFRDTRSTDPGMDAGRFEPFSPIGHSAIASPLVGDEDGRSQTATERDDFRALPEHYTPSASRPASILGPPSILRSSLPAGLGGAGSPTDIPGSGAHSATPSSAGAVGVTISDPRPTPFEVGSPCSSVCHYGPIALDNGLHALPPSGDKARVDEDASNAGAVDGLSEA